MSNKKAFYSESAKKLYFDQSLTVMFDLSTWCTAVSQCSRCKAKCLSLLVCTIVCKWEWRTDEHVPLTCAQWIVGYWGPNSSGCIYWAIWMWQQFFLPFIILYLLKDAELWMKDPNTAPWCVSLSGVMFWCAGEAGSSLFKEQESAQVEKVVLMDNQTQDENFSCFLCETKSQYRLLLNFCNLMLHCIRILT